MMNKPNLSLITVIAVLVASCKNDSNQLTEFKILNDYPSASGIEFYDKEIYVIGNDANNLLLLDSNLNITDSIPLYSFPGKRIPTAVKPDLECMTIAPDGRLLLLGSGSLVPYRNGGWLIDLKTKQKDSIRFSNLYSLITAYTGITEINIEGAAYIPGYLVLANRGNKNYPVNQLLFVRQNYPDSQIQSIHSGLIGYSDSTTFKGVSGLAYSARSDILICTVSTEYTRNSMDDGAIGKSYLWIVNNFSPKKKWKAINPDKIIDLYAIDSRFKGQKIESACIIKETAKKLYLLLAAENDNGSSTLFRLAVSKN